MTSFLDKLNEKLGTERKVPVSSHQAFISFMKQTPVPVPTPPSAASEKQTTGIDMCRLEGEILVYVQAPGASLKDFDITLNAEGDEITVRATRSRPSAWKSLVAALSGAEEKFAVQECVWEPIYRKISLPVEIDIGLSRAFFEHGTLVLYLPVFKKDEPKKLAVVDIVNPPAK